ncbi:hypothetical protein, partial [Sulfitobacter litoralis]
GGSSLGENAGSVLSDNQQYWRANREDLAEMIELIEDLIFDHLFCLAAANMLKANLISRKLGLARR